MHTLEITAENFISTLQDIIHRGLSALFNAIISSLKSLLSSNDEPLTNAFTVRSKIDKVSWTAFSNKAMQVPEGLVGNLYEFAKFISDQGIYLMRDAVAILKLLDNDLSILLANGQTDIGKRRNQVDLHINKQATFYSKYSEFIKDNGLSHQPIYNVLLSPMQCIQWYNTTATSLPLVTHAEVKEWVALLSQVSAKLDRYVVQLKTTDNRALLAQGMLMSKVINDFATKVDIISVVAMAIQMNRRAAVVFSKSI